MENHLTLTKKLHVLFVDDERLIREMASDMLSDTVGHVSLASNGQEGLDFYLNSLRPVDIVISDQTMPIMQGLDMLEKIKAHNPSQKCIMITAHSETKYMLRAIEIGIEHFIIKPIIFDKLDDILYDLALKIEQELLQKEREKFDQREQIQHAFNTSLESLINNIPLPSMILDQNDQVIAGNSEIFSIFAGTPYYKKLIDKDLNFKDLLSDDAPLKNDSQFCDWKEEFLLIGEELDFDIEKIIYSVKIKRILSDDNTRFYVLCLIERQN
jgi:YesN/AraC family two-component response regulator